MAGLLSEAEVLAPGVPAFETMKPYLSVLTWIGVFATASDVASAANRLIIQELKRILAGLQPSKQRQVYSVYVDS